MALSIVAGASAIVGSFGALARYVRGPPVAYCSLQDKPQIAVNNVCVPMSTTLMVPDATYISNNEANTKVNSTTLQISPMQYLLNGQVTSNVVDLSYNPDTNAYALQCKCIEGPVSPSFQSANLTGQCYRMQCTSGYTGQLYIEVSGGLGATFQYSSLDGTIINYPGGKNGTVFGNVLVTKGDIIDVIFGFNAVPATPQNIASGTYPRTPGGGGSGTLLAGSNGGGATSVQILNPNVPSTPILVGAGGGGAGRNAAGGNAGSYNITKYKKPVENPVGLGFAGGPLNIENPGSNIAPTFEINQLSGGGGSFQSGGRSVLGELGTALQGGNSNADLCGGGGGGSGYPGGGAGSWNQIAKPGNLQGAGGGGCSYVDSKKVLFGSIDGQSVCVWNRDPGQNSNITVPQSAYIVFGYPTNV